MDRGQSMNDRGNGAIFAESQSHKNVAKALELNLSEDAERHLVENIGGFIYTLDTEGNVISISTSAKRFLGRGIEDILKENFSMWFPEEELPSAMNLFRNTLKGKSSQIETVLIDESGNLHDMECVSTPILKDNKVVATRGVLKDITEIKQIKGVLKESEAKYRQIFELAPEAIIVLDRRGNVEDINNRVYDFLGYVHEDVIEKNILELPFLPENSKAKVMEKFTQRMSGKEVPPYELEFTAKSGEMRVGRIVATIVKDENGEITEDIAMISDITEHKRIEMALRESEEKFRSFMETAKDFMHITDADGNTTYANRAMLDALGYLQKEIRGMHITQFFTKESLEEDFKPNWKKYITHGRMDIDVRFRSKAGREICGELRCVAVYDGNGEYVGNRAVFHDITERKKMEGELQKTVSEVQRFNDVAVGREMQMIELKREVNDLRHSLGRKEKYKIFASRDARNIVGG